MAHYVKNTSDSLNAQVLWERQCLHTGRLKLSMLMFGFRSSTGREFQTEGPAIETARRSYVLNRYRGTTSWMMTTVGPQTLSRGNVGHWRPIVHQVLRSFCVLTSVCHNAELEANPLRNVVIIVLSSFIIEVVIRNFHICMWKLRMTDGGRQCQKQRSDQVNRELRPVCRRQLRADYYKLTLWQMQSQYWGKDGMRTVSLASCLHVHEGLESSLNDPLEKLWNVSTGFDVTNAQTNSLYKANHQYRA